MGVAGNGLRARAAWCRAALALALSAALGTAAAAGGTGTTDAGVCGRSPAVAAAIAAVAGEDCGDIDAADLHGVLALDLSGHSLGSIAANDFGGLVRLRELDLSDNALTSLPEGVFDDLGVLDTLGLADNALASLPTGAFDSLLALRTLTLHGNALATLPDGVFDELLLLETLTLHGNGLASLPDTAGLFDALSPFWGLPLDGPGDPPRGAEALRRFVAEAEIDSVEGFVAALPASHKRNFVMVYESLGLGAEFVSREHPRMISWGADGRFLFAWTTDPDAAAPFGTGVEFLIAAGATWDAGVVDFSGEAPTIVRPESCASCHGELLKPVWGSNSWLLGDDPTDVPEEAYAGTEEHAWRDAEVWSATSALMASENARIAPMDFAASTLAEGDARRLRPFATVAEEFGAAVGRRHAEVQFRSVLARDDSDRLLQRLSCRPSSPYSTYYEELLLPPKEDWRPSFVPALHRNVGAVGGLRLWTYFHFGSMGHAFRLRAYGHWWRNREALRALFAETSNRHLRDDLRQGGFVGTLPDLHFHEPGTALMEDELIRALRQSFGHGSSLNVEVGKTAYRPEGRSRVDQDRRVRVDDYALPPYRAMVGGMEAALCDASYLRNAAPSMAAASELRDEGSRIEVEVWYPSHVGADLYADSIRVYVTNGIVTVKRVIDAPPPQPRGEDSGYFLRIKPDADAEWVGVEVPPYRPRSAGAMVPGGSWKISTATGDVLPSADASLLGLVVSGADVGWFDPAKTAYTARAPHGQEETTVAPTKSHFGATFEITPADANADRWGHQVALPVGDTEIEVAVTAEDGETTATYAVTVTRAASDDAMLAGLSLTGVDLGTFASGTTSYSANVANDMSSTTVTARTSHADAEVAIAPADADGATPEHQVALAVGDTVVTVTVTAADGATTETYTVTVTRAKSADATLASLALAGVDFGTFASGTRSYAAQVANDVESTTVEADATDDDARVDIAPGDADAVAPGHQVALAVGATAVTATVTAADGAATATYTVTVTRVGSADAALSSLSLTGVDLGSFDPATLTYSAVTELSTLTVAASAAGAGATVSVPGGTRDADGNWTVPLAEGDNEIAVTVTAQDGTTRTYTVTVRRAPAGTATCRDGTALADPEGNPGLVRDCETLLSLKDELDPTGDMNWGDQPGFRRLDLGEWDTVAVRDGRVRGIAWDGTDSSISLRGVLPAALGELDALEVLRLDSHGLRGGLPASLGRLSRLEVLDLGYNWWMDEEPLPAWLGELTSLRRVRLHAHAPGTVPDSWSSLTRLEDLELYAPTGATGAAGPVASWLGDLPALRRLVLLQRRSTGRIPLSLAREFDELDLRMNALAGCVPAQLAESENARASEQGLGAGRYRLPACALSVDAGAGGEVSAGATAELSATAAGHHGDATLVWSWTQESGPSVALTDAGTATPSFAVPVRGAADAEFAFSVTVHDAEATSGRATATVTHRLPGFAGTAAPVVSGPVLHAVVEGDTAVATLAATDADTAAERLSWRLSGGSDASHFALGGSGSLSFVSAKDYEAPDDADGDGTYAVSVEVSDGLRSGSASLSVALVNRNEAPTAEAGPDQSDVAAGATVTLSGSATDPDAGDALTYAWTQVSGASVELSSSAAASATFAAPASGGALTFRLRATDAGGLWGEDETTVSVLASADARLRSLALSDVDFGAFDAETLSYAAAVEGEVESTTVAAAAWEPAARVEISPSDADGGAADHQVALAVGETVVSVTVTAADGTTTRTYAVTVTRVSPVSWGDRLAERDVELDGIGIASGVWSDGDTVWVSDWEDPAVRAYALAGGARRSGKDLTELPATRAAGLWSDGSTLWVADFSGAAVHARDLSTGAAASGGLADLDDAGNATPTGVWSDGTTLWVSDYYDRKAYAYARSDGARTSSRDVALSGVGRAFGLWSAGGTLLAADWTGGRVRAYRLSDGTRLADLDIDTKAAGNAKPMGLWSDGETLWVSDEQDDRLYAYAVPAPSGQDAKSVARFAIPDAALSAALGAALDAQGGSRDPGALTSLDLSDLGIADLTGIEAATALRTLDVSGNAVVDLGPLSRLHALAELDVGRNLHLRDLAPLASLRNLRVLRASDNAIADVSPLGRLTGLAELDLSGNMIRDASPLAALGGLSRLDLGDNAVADLAPLAGLGAGVVLGLDAQLALPASSPTAYFADAQLRAVVAAALGKVPDAVVTEAELGLLTALDAPVPGLADLRDLGRATRLRALRLEGGRIADLWPLAELGGLRRLGLPGNAVRDVTALAGLGGLRVLDLSGNAVSDVRPLARLRSLERLDLGGNPVGDAGALGDLEGLVWLRVPDARGVPVQRLLNLRRLSDDAGAAGERDGVTRR